MANSTLPINKHSSCLFRISEKKTRCKSNIAIILAIIVIAFTILSYDYRSLSFSISRYAAAGNSCRSSFCFRLFYIVYENADENHRRKAIDGDLSKQVFVSLYFGSSCSYAGCSLLGTAQVERIGVFNVKIAR
jgi:hypothetical protein